MSSRSAVDLSTRTVKIYSGAADATARADITEHVADVANPHDVTAEQIGLGDVDNTSDAAKPVSGPQAAALALKAPLASPALSGVPTAPTAALGTATDQVATTAFAYAAANDAIANAATGDTPLADHLADVSNPHQITKAQVGLALVDNTADVDKPVSNPTQAAINAAVAGVGGDTIADDLAEHLADTSNPHVTTKAQVGLGAVDNTADVAKPVSSAQQAAINAAAAIGTAAQADIDGHQANTSNPHATTKAQVGLGAVDNTADASKPVSAAQQTAINAAAAVGTAAQADIDGHQANVSNPHATTKAQVGLGAVDNTSDIAKPVSTATQAAINAAIAGVSGGTVADDLADHLADLANPHATTKAQVGLANVDNTSDLLKPVSNATQIALNLKAPLSSPALVGTPTGPTAAPGTSSTQLATTAFADAIGDSLTASLAAHTGNVSNPHATTKAQVGLGAVDNTSDAAKPVSTAQAAALALKAPLASPALTGVPTGPTAAPGTSSTQLATTAFADAIGDSLRASLDGAANASDRPGDAVALYGTLATGTAAAMPRVDPTWVATSAAGNVVRVNSATADDPQIIAPAAAFTVGPMSDVRWSVQRQTDPIDPLNDSVTLAIRWLSNTHAGVAGAAGISTVANLPLVIADGIVTRTARIGGGGLVPPAGAVYFRPYVQLFGNNHVTDVIVLGVSTGCDCLPFVIPITGTTALVAGAAGLVLVNAAAPLTVTLPPGPVAGQTLTIKDAAGTAATWPITIDGGTPLIEGANTLVVNFNYGWATLTYSGSQWVQT